MKRLTKYLGTVALLICLVPSLAILISGQINIVDAPFRARRLKRLRQSVKEEWLPDGRYLYIDYKLDGDLGGFIEMT